VSSSSGKKKERGAYSVESVKERLLLKSGFVQLAPQEKLISVVYFSVFASRKKKRPFHLTCAPQVLKLYIVYWTVRKFKSG
jgi:hypothetical protein